MAIKDDGPPMHPCACLECREQPQGAVAQQHSVLNRLLALSDEKSRRLIAATLAQQHGRGGIARLALITGLSRTTIRRGLWELEHPETLEAGRIRRPGGGRPRLEKKVPVSSPPWRRCCAMPRRGTRCRD